MKFLHISVKFNVFLSFSAYNALHLISIYILPYSVELLCYALMLILMKEFHSDGNDKKIRQER